MFKENILVVEDDVQIRNFITYTLKQENYQVYEADSGQAAIDCQVEENIDLMLLDLGLPDIDGMVVLHKIREYSQMPIIIVSARDQDNEKVIALDDGADDYLTKPFSATELLARIRVALRHYYSDNQKMDISVIQNGKIKADTNKHIITLKEKEVHFSPLEYQLLVLFLKNVGKVLTYNVIIHELWGSGYGNDTQALRALMAGLRRKIEDNPAKPEYINTEIGVGYRMNEIE
ncbi:MAG: response regulator transcription factor [Thomasclavelia sp.]|nr:response regulator transcription factor [Thomasclavelia sp.]